MSKFGERVLVAYSMIASAAVIITFLTGAASQRVQTFDEIRVHRIEVVEPDGTLRMVIANKDRLPGVIVKGTEQPKVDRPYAGMLFYNDEGTENGGLVFGGHKNPRGEVIDSGGSLSFDQYGASQIVQLAGVDDVANHFAGLAVNAERKQRIWVGRTGDGTATIALRDGAGRRRIVMLAPADGTPSLEFLDTQGHVVQRLAPISP
jgi:hypothetical protein